MVGQYGMPGMSAIQESVERSLIWGGDVNQVGVLLADSEVLSSTTVDGGSTPTTDLRAGLLLGKLDTGSELVQWDGDAADGSQNIHSILPLQMSTLDEFATAEDKLIAPIVRAPLVAQELLIQGSAFVGHVDEFLARRVLASRGCLFDDDVENHKSGLARRYARVTGTTDTLTTAENGSQIWYSNAASVTVTLPTIQAGLEFTLIREGDEEFVIASAEGDNIVSINDLSADSVTFTTANEHLGAGVKVSGVYMGTTLKWIVELLPIPAATAVGTDLSALTYAVAT